MEQIKSNPRNDRLKRDYLIYLKHARQRSQATVEQVRHAVDRFEAYNRFKDFGTFNKEQALAFKRHLLATKGQRSEKPISTSTAHHVLRSVKDFLIWLHGRPGFRRRIDPTEVAYLNLTAKEDRQAHSVRPKACASFEQYRAALLGMPCETDVERRDQAAMALLLLTNMRDGALISLKLKHVDAERGYVFQDPNEVKTKFSKSIESFFLPVGQDVADIFRSWVHFLIQERLFGPDDPVFPKTRVAPNADQVFSVQGLTRDHWADAAPVREIFRQAFRRVGLPYFRPHSVRHTLTNLAYRLNLSHEQMKAWSQNMGHDSVMITLANYGVVAVERQEEIMAELGQRSSLPAQADFATQVAEKVAALIQGRPLGL